MPGTTAGREPGASRYVKTADSASEAAIAEGDEDGGSTPTAVLPAEPGAATEPLEPQARVVYVDRPQPPRVRGNRGLGVLLVVLGTVLYAVLVAFTVLIVMRVTTDQATLTDLANPGYWLPVLVFFVVFLLSVLLLNRASWPAHLVSSLVVALLVYALSGFLVAVVEVYALHNDVPVADALASPVAIVSAVLAREIALWAGVILGRRGRSLTARNAAERAEYDRRLAEARPS
jgi:hypothetical protein